MEIFVQKWVGKVSKNYAERVGKGLKIEPKRVQKSSKIDAEIEVGKKIEKVTLRMAPVSSSLYRDFSFGHPFRPKTVENGIRKIMKKSRQKKCPKIMPKGSKRDAKCSQNGSQNLRKSI